MPQITVEYSAELRHVLDRRAFGLALHPIASEIVGSPVSAFKTRFRPIEEGVIADGTPQHAMFHVQAAILSGRDGATKDKLGKAIMELMKKALPPQEGRVIQFTVEIRDMDRDHYQKDVV